MPTSQTFQPWRDVFRPERPARTQANASDAPVLFFEGARAGAKKMLPGQRSGCRFGRMRRNAKSMLACKPMKGHVPAQVHATRAGRRCAAAAYWMRREASAPAAIGVWDEEERGVIRADTDTQPKRKPAPFQDASGQHMKGHAPGQALCDARRKGACNGTLSAPRNRRIRGVLGRSDALLARIWYAIQTQARTGSGCLQAAYGRRSWRRLCDGCRKGGMSALQRHIESIAKPVHPR